MSTKRSRKHQWIVLRQKASRHLKHYYDGCYYHHKSRWRAVKRAQTEYESMVSVLHPTRRNLPQGKTEPPGLLRFVKAPFEPDPFEPFCATKEDKQ